MSKPNDAHQIGIAIGKLVDRLTRSQDELARREASGGTAHNVRAMNRLRDEIESLTIRIERAEKLQTSMLQG